MDLDRIRLQRRARAAGHDLDDERAPGRSSASALLQRRAGGAPLASGIVDAETAVAAASGGSGGPLPAELRERFEASLGADLSAVRVHVGEASADASAAIGARAYTLGQDIHFADGQYDPHGADGQHLLAHEVAHTVQQAGGAASARQAKMEVSQPGDALEVEADHAADAMVAGERAEVRSSTGVARAIMRSGGPSGALGVGGGGTSFDLNIASETAKYQFGYAEAELGASIKIGFKPKSADGGGAAGGGDAGGGGGGGPAELKGGATTGGKFKLEAEKKFDDIKNGANIKLSPKVSTDIEWEKGKPPTLSLGGALEIGKELKGATFDAGPLEVALTGFKWEAGKAPTALALSAKLPVKSKPVTVTLLGQQFEVTTTGEFSGSVQPNLAKIAETLGKQVATVLSSQAAAAAGAIAAPLLVFAGGLVAWAKAGHEFDEVTQRILALRAKCRAAAAEALTGVHEAHDFAGMDLMADVTGIADKIRTDMALELGVPEGGLGAAAKSKPGLKTDLYFAAWNTTWASLKAELLAHYQDGVFTSYKFERQWLERAWDKGTE